MSDTSQGPGWWQASDGKWYPPEQAPGATPTPPPGAPGGYGAPQPGYGGPAPAGPVSATEPFGWAWNKFTANAGPIIIAVAGFIAAVVVVGIISYVIRVNSTSFFLNLIVSLSTIFVSLLIQIGVIRVALKVVDGRPIDTEGVFSTDGLAEFFVAALILTIPYLFCYIPGIIIGFFGGWFGFFVVDRGEKGIDAIKSSFKLVSDNLGTVIVWSILAAVILFVGYCFCLIGTFVAMPLVVIAQAYLYRRLTGGAVAA